MEVEVLWRESRRALAMRTWMRWTLALAFFQLWENFFLRLMARCALRSSAAYRLNVERGVDGSIRKRGEANDTHVDAYGIALCGRLFYFAFGLHRDEPFAVAVA